MRKNFVPKEHLTNEALRKIFKNNFRLANQSIELCRYYLKSGHDVNLDQILEEICRNPAEDYLKDLMALEAEDDESNDKE